MARGRWRRGSTTSCSRSTTEPATATLPSPELQVQLTGTGSLIISPPATFPANAAGITVFVGTTSGAETGQGNTVGPTQVFTQNETPVTTATTLPTTNTSACSIAFNDTIIPYSGYNVSLLSSSGNAYPGWPQAWQLNGGVNGTVNISNGAPLWNGTILYPQPILSQPLNHGPQSISGLLDMSGYKIQNTGGIGVGIVPVWGVDVVWVHQQHAGIPGEWERRNCGAMPGVERQLVSSRELRNPAHGLLPARAKQSGRCCRRSRIINFTPRFAAADNPGATRTDVDLATTAVTPGSLHQSQHHGRCVRQRHRGH